MSERVPDLHAKCGPTFGQCTVCRNDAAMQEEARRYNLGAVECPGCHEVKYVGHGPLCHTCFMTRAFPPAATSDRPSAKEQP